MPAIPIRKCAKEVAKSVPYVRKLVDDGEVPATVNGGSAGHPRLLVDPDDVRAAMKRVAAYVPPALRGKPGHRRHRRPPTPRTCANLDPVSAAM